MTNGDRIRQAREIAGMTQQELAEKIGVVQSHVALFEQNLRQPQEHTLRAIALATGFPPAFFRRESAPEFPLGSLLYRRRKSMGSKDRDRVRQAGRLVFEVVLDMAERFKPLDLRLPKIADVEPELAATMTRADLGFSPDTPITHFINRLEKNGVVIAAVPYQIDEHDAFSAWADTDPRTPVIVMTAGRPADRQRWNVAHETGHLVMHYNYRGSPAELEAEAHRFAAEFLLPEDAIRKDLGAGPLTLTFLADLKSRWGVSMRALIMRAFHLDIISDGQRRYLFRQMAVKKWVLKEPVSIPQEKPRLLRKLAEALYGPHFDVKSIAGPLGIPAPILRSVIDLYASALEMKGIAPSARPALVPERGRLLTMLPRGPEH